MNDEDIERELARLIPAAPPDALMARLQSALPASRKIVRFPAWIAFAAAAAVVAAFIALWPEKPAQPGRLETFHPVETDQYLVSARDLGVVALRSGEPYRLVHCVWADRETYRSEGGGSHLEVRQAREQIVPVALHLQ